MRIESIETFSNQFVSVVRVRTGDGNEGWGVQVCPSWLETADRVVSEL